MSHVSSLGAGSQHRIPRIALVLFALALSACPELGNGHRRTESRDFSDFTAVDNHSDLDVRVEQGETFAVSVAIDENLIDRVEMEVVDSTLRIHMRGQFGSLVNGPHVRITMPVLTSARISGDGDLEARDFADGEAVELRIAGDGDLSWNGDALELTVSVHGDGDLHLEGSAEVLDLRALGDGDVHARGCVAQTAHVEISGDGDASVDVRGDLAFKIHGDGDLDVYGNPHVSSATSSGDGDIHLH
jgi:hypothetical protein